VESFALHFLGRAAAPLDEPFLQGPIL